MELQFWATTDTGRVREHNEDNFLVDKRLQLFVVCDGMGGHAAGEVASAVCVRTVREFVYSERQALVQLESDPDSIEYRQAVLNVLGNAIRLACARIFEMSAEDATRRGMGTTCTMLLIHGDRAFVGHVGDSRVYMVRDNKLHQVTEDHSLLNEMIRQGKIKPGDNTDFPHKNAVTRAVGVREFVEVDVFDFDAEDGDRFLVCSDGLSGYFTSDEGVIELLSGDNLEAITQDCIEFAKNGGGKDNITVIIVDTMVKAVEEHSVEDVRAVEVLRATPFFQYLDNRELLKVVGLAEQLNVDADHIILAHDDPCQQMFVVLDGALAVHLDGRQIGTLTSGDSIGELSLMDDKPLPVTVCTTEPSTILTLKREQFVGLLRSDPGLAIKVMWNLLQVFAGKMREVPYDLIFHPEALADDFKESPGDLTPPSGNLVFSEDLRRAAQKKIGTKPDAGEPDDETVSFEPPAIEPPVTAPPVITSPVLESSAVGSDAPALTPEPETDLFEEFGLFDDLLSPMMLGGHSSLDEPTAGEIAEEPAPKPARTAVAPEPQPKPDADPEPAAEGDGGRILVGGFEAGEQTEVPEDLRKTLQFDWDSPPTAPLLNAAPALVAAAAARKPIPPIQTPKSGSSTSQGSEPKPPAAKPATPNKARPLGKPISGTSVVQKAKIPHDAFAAAGIVKKSTPIGGNKKAGKGPPKLPPAAHERETLPTDYSDENNNDESS